MSSKGFTLIELSTAIFVLAVVIIEIYGVFVQTSIATSILSSRLTAAYLAKEGVEITRNIRDTNWVEGASWKDGLNAGDWRADYDDGELTLYVGSFLNLTASGFYSYSAGTPTQFKRKITITNIAADVLKVSVLIEWQEKARQYSFTAEEYLYNWY